MILYLGTSAVERTYTQFRDNLRLKNSRKRDYYILFIYCT